ncbi:MAG: hypothetical protein JGK24_15700 [Microcoleus sp. PH2017_29_MFU_D_A]|jgi:hypothetical protein|uniref:hypothetical protein n=2 Tax=unclassified Microcoleus TaxID=2642155 RepID=UPI001DC9D159|nr:MULTISPECIES: hypothetical protein [unclassified Microcoleus]MCC3421465.1 hypothetical protein [Microcoleus sp. PH2017_07_MST_O_A]MCC3432780.1 hypothetical protein [Microcoleus sp. PH2017_04_SCI_O_A]MCC3454686.1 hypothetical protein [Microcoleus sp. PH2017_08_TRC_O_A]MCC3469509.1 hypothetical protein [Microcoleus sp. PH2017_06_SFM_O_A]MCC3507313.1 hypothetical protein [Microcoleus sp. PH2017_19_SFW_U_A]MCC3512215.1 hypothetical protein [Microcoleus sp. PH2017_17_BER_D_A]MCC3526060.1 hypot
MLDLIFYTFKTDRPPHYIEMSEDVYEWLAKSEFSKIGKSVPRNILIDEEEEKLPLVELDRDIRQKLRSFFRDAIICESDTVLTKLGDSPLKEEYQSATYRLRKLLDLLKCVENEDYQYLQRVL